MYRLTCVFDIFMLRRSNDYLLQNIYTSIKRINLTGYGNCPCSAHVWNVVLGMWYSIAYNPSGLYATQCKNSNNNNNNNSHRHHHHHYRCSLYMYTILSICTGTCVYCHFLTSTVLTLPPIQLLITRLRKVYCWVWQWKKLQSVNNWQSYQQKRDCLVHFLRLLAVCWPGAQSTWDNHALACNFAKYSPI